MSAPGQTGSKRHILTIGSVAQYLPFPVIRPLGLDLAGSGHLVIQA